jgi:hypothetical protein
MAQTDEGKVVQLKMVYRGTPGGFQKATLTIFDQHGRVEFEVVFEEAAQHAATLHDGMAIIVFHGLSGDADAFLTFVGKNHDTDKLRAALEDPEREKDAGNLLRVSIYRKEEEQEYSLCDLVAGLYSEE